MKYRHCDGKLVLKVTDNREVLICLFSLLYFLFWFYFSHWFSLVSKTDCQISLSALGSCQFSCVEQILVCKYKMQLHYSQIYMLVLNGCFLSVSCSARNLFRSLGFKFRKMMNCNCMNLPTSYGSGRMIYPQFCQ